MGFTERFRREPSVPWSSEEVARNLESLQGQTVQMPRILKKRAPFHVHYMPQPDDMKGIPGASFDVFEQPGEEGFNLRHNDPVVRRLFKHYEDFFNKERIKGTILIDKPQEGQDSPFQVIVFSLSSSQWPVDKTIKLW